MAPTTPKHLHQSYLSVPHQPAERSVRKRCYAASKVPECHRPRTRHAGPPIRHSGEGRNPEGRREVWQRHQNSPTNQRTQFSYLGVPAPVGTSQTIGTKASPETPIRDTWLPGQTDESRSFRRDPQLPAPQLGDPPLPLGEGWGEGQSWGENQKPLLHRRHNLAYTAFRPTKMPTLDTKLTPVGFYPTEMSGYYPTAKNRPVRYYLVW